MSSVALPRRRPDDEFTGDVHVYEPHRVGVPPLRIYLVELWRRRQFAVEMARTTLRAQHFETALGQLWLILNPLLLTLVYFLLVDILRHGHGGPNFFAHLMAAMFLYHFFSQSMQEGVTSVVGGGKLILNSAFPRALLPISAVLNGFMRFLPCLVVYGVVHVVSGQPVGPTLLWAFPIFGLVVIFTLGAVMLVSAMQVYFRDIRNFLPYFLRILMYASPVLYYVHEVSVRFKPLLYINPLTSLIGSWSAVLNKGEVPSTHFLELGIAWSFAVLLFGALFFISREREFAVRL
jgi:teichoic acid transport system permease protein